MSLQVWLPLTNGTLKQQGLKNISATIGGTVGLTDVGKLGKCATIGTAAGGITLPASAMTSFTECSVAFWINITSWNTDWDTIFQAGLGSTPWNNYIFGILRNQGNYLCFTVSNGSSTSSGSYASSNLTVGQWMHLTFTYGNGKCKIYINGVLDKEYSTSITPNFAGITHIAIGRSTNGSNYQCKCKLNDFRIYDHCLSPMEVKELAKGLVLHYPLNRQGWGQENQLKNSNFFNGTNSWYSVNSSSIRVETKDGYTCGTGTKGTSANIIGQTSAAYTGGIAVDITVSAKVYVTETGTFGVGHWISTTQVSGWQSMSGSRVWNTTNNLSVGWNYISTTLKNATNQYTGSIVTAFSYSGTTFWITDVKLEYGSIATPWCPNSSDTLATTMGLNSTTEYDCSGFCNNGSKMTDTITYTSDTAKYAVSTHFNGTYDGIIIENLALKDMINSAITYAFWIKPESESGVRSIYFGSYSGISWSVEKTAGNQLRLYWNGSPDETCSGAIITDGVWQHICITKNGTNDVKVYINGIQKWTSTATHSSLNFPTTYRIGRDTRNNDGTPYKGLMSDFRIYATALSADDVKSLYQNCATIDPDGTIRGQIRS